MGFLHRLFGRRAADVWRAEGRLLHRLGYVQPPQAVQWISTSACDLHCPHCYSHAGKRSAGELSTREAETLLLDGMVALERPVLVIAGGETLLRPDFPEIIAAAKRRKISWGIHTHGGHVARHIDVFKHHPPVMAAVSLDGPRAYHDDFRGKKGSFDAAIRAFQLLKDAGVPEVVAGTTITRGNADLLADFAADVFDSAADSWGFHLMTPEGRAGQNLDLLPTQHQLRRAAAFGRRMRAVFHVEHDNEWGSAGGDDAFYRDNPFVCGAGRFACVVSATGEVMPCTTTDITESAGNIRDKKLADIWADGFSAFRKGEPGLKGDCDDCWLQTRHGNSARLAFTLDLFAEPHRPLIPLMQVRQAPQEVFA